MSKLPRSPPSNSQKLTPKQSKMNTEQKEAAIYAQEDPGNIRNKRPRVEHSPIKDIGDQLTDKLDKGITEIKRDIQKMLTDWKNEQESSISKLLKDWKKEQDATLSKLVKEVTSLKSEIQDMKNKNSDFEKSMHYFNQTHEELKAKVNEIEKTKVEYDAAVKGIESTIYDLQIQSRSSRIEIRNVPMQSGERASHLVSLVTDVGKIIGIEIKPEELRDTYRIPSKPGTTKPIVAEFTTLKTKHDFLQSARSFNKNKRAEDKLNTEYLKIPGKKSPVYIDDHVPPSKRKLLHQARSFAKANGYHCRFANGKVLLRKSPEDKFMQITSEQCLSSLKNPE